VTLAELLETYRRRAVEAAAVGSSAPLANTYEAIVAELAPLVNGNGAAHATPAPPDRWLTADQVAELLGTSRRWAYSHADELGGKRLSPRCLRFSDAAVRRHMERRR
jgi:predicted DNA-binding transcriptional regulator AlpA